MLFFFTLLDILEVRRGCAKDFEVSSEEIKQAIVSKHPHNSENYYDISCHNM